MFDLYEYLRENKDDAVLLHNIVEIEVIKSNFENSFQIRQLTTYKVFYGKSLFRIY